MNMDRQEFVGAALLGFGIAWLIAGFFRPDPVIRYRHVEVPETVIVQGEPDTIVQIRERLVFRTVEPEQTAIAREAAQPDVAAFCAAAGWVSRTEARRVVDDRYSVAVADSTLGPPPVEPNRLLLIRSFEYDRGAFTIWGPLSTGDLWRGDYRVGARFQGRVVGDSVLIQSRRFGWVREWGTRALWAGGGAMLGYIAAEVR